MQKLSTSATTTYKTKQQYVYQTLRDAIMLCELTPGQKLVISDISKQLEVSAIPVREALQLLHSEGIVAFNPHAGAIVAPITKGSIAETFTIKEGLESAATRVAVQKITSDQLDDLYDQLTRMGKTFETGEFEKWAQWNAQFHSTIVEIAGMPELKEMHSKIVDKWDRIRQYYYHEVLLYRHEQSHKEHCEIVDAITNKDGKKAVQLTSSHNLNALEDYIKRLS